MTEGFSATAFLKKIYKDREQETPREKLGRPQLSPEKTSSDRPPAEQKVDIKRNYHKEDNDVSDKLAPLQTLAEQAIYRRLYRLSYGNQRTTCRVGMGALAKACNIKSWQKTVRVALDGLAQKGHIKAYDTTPEGTLYRVFLPCEIPGIESKTIVETTIVPSTIVKTTIGAGTGDSTPPDNIPNGTIVNSTIGRPPGVVKNTIVANTIPPLVKNTIVENTIGDCNAVNTPQNDSIVNFTIVKNTTNKDIKEKKEKSVCVSVSSMQQISYLVDRFYELTRQKASTHTRTRALDQAKELIEDKFSVEEIEYAIEWTVRNKSNVHAFGFVVETIGEALKEREREDTLQERLRAESERKQQKREREEARVQLERKVEELHEKMTDEEREALRNQAEELVLQDPEVKGTEPPFLKERLVFLKERQLLKERHRELFGDLLEQAEGG